MQNKKPLIYFSTYDDIQNPYYAGGGAVAVHEVAKRLSKDYDVRVLSWDYCGKKKEIIDDVTYERFGIPQLSPKVGMFVYQLMLPYVARKKRFDLWCESFCPPFTTAFLPLFVKSPVIGIVHMLAAEDMERKYKLPFHLIQNKGLKKYKNIIVTSEVLKKKVLGINAHTHVRVISNGISQVFKPMRQKEKYILFLGRIEVDQKGIDLLIRAFKKFFENHMEYKLIIAGSGAPAEIEKTKKLIQDASLTKNIVLAGKVSGTEKNTLLQRAACLVVSSRFETYSLVALEALAHGAPLVNFAIEGLSWIPAKAVIKVKPFDTNAFSEAFSKIVSDRTMSESMMIEGNIYAKNHTWDAIATVYTDYIDTILKQ
jgi:glycosyltransferase involved in cell wall biosynthesis